MAEKSYAHRARIDKLGVKPQMRVALAGVTDDPLLDEIAARDGQVAGAGAKGLDMVFLQVDAPAGLAKVATWAKRIAPTGAVWVITPRKTPGLMDTDVMRAGKAAGLVDVKVTRFSETHTALKFMVPKDKR